LEGMPSVPNQPLHLTGAAMLVSGNS